jgi:general secretion pathway protein J
MKIATNCKPTAFSRNKRRLPGPATVCCRGFTLIEILAAIFIFALVTGLTYGSFEGVFSSADRVNAGSQLYEMGSVCIERMVFDLQDIHVMTYPRYAPPDIDDEPNIYQIKGESAGAAGESFARLRFASLAHLDFRSATQQGIAQIVYYVQETEGDGFVLRRSDHLYPYPEFEENPLDPVLCEQVRAFELIYYDDEGREFEDWDSESDDYEYSTPRSIRIKLALGQDPNLVTFETAVTLPLYRPKKVKR